MDQDQADKMLRACIENGINYFDNAEAYQNGNCEISMGRAIKNNSFKREDLVISTKIYFGTGGWGPNAHGLSKKHIIEGIYASLNRLQLDYVDLIFAHRPDIETNMEEVVRGFNFLIKKGKALYWGTSEWNSQQITEAHAIAQKLKLVGPCIEQPQYNLFKRIKVEKDYLPIIKNFGLGITVWGALDNGILTGKYNDSIPLGSRLNDSNWGKLILRKFNTDCGKIKVDKVKKLSKIANKLGRSTGQLSLAWCLSNPSVSSVIMGASNTEQLLENLKSIDLIERLTPDIISEIEDTFQSKPAIDPIFR
ncbi:Aldo/keto reductase [Conidiobolus coronatus NRRL 28638]|uniref:Aldo/keto reductase n=1 Tax=Conidiobolus coronatus (strain ATCC 28846 / CBS 209.66 / NRRL 28638) TaxID=796925 RepID=A0A137P9N3_CONC2|nr:Aldo/keto reductase [Conidiobolus coronatus NRRL 28638]|eukprot:KXN71715.1 Aldo/keto reductase [Conidiobolus coronatus NRRL 28638]